MLNLTKNIFIFFALTIVLSSCISRVEKNGYMFDLAELDAIKEDVTTKDRLLNILGSPSLTSNLDDNEVWIYYSQDVKKLLFFKPKIIARTVLAVEFDNKDQTVKKIQKLELEDGSVLSFSTKQTEVKSEKIGFFKSLFGNIGSVTAR